MILEYFITFLPTEISDFFLVFKKQQKFNSLQFYLFILFLSNINLKTHYVPGSLPSPRGKEMPKPQFILKDLQSRN